MIGGYQGTSGAERALRQVVEAMVMPAGVDAKLSWPVFGNADKSGPLMAYQRADTGYETGQTKRLLNVELIVFNIYIWSSNENLVLSIMEALEGGFDAYPLTNALQATRAYLATLHEDGGGQLPTGAQMIVDQVDDVLDTGMVQDQERELAKVNRLLADLAGIATEADWGAVLDTLGMVQSRITVVPPYNFWPIGCRDLTAPEVWQLGLSGRVFSVAAEFTAT